jgi:hypothetical protein
VSDKTEHRYEVEARHEDGRASLMIEAATGKRAGALERSALGYAATLLAEHPEVTSVGIYHTYPSPGPVRRFVTEVKR